MQRKMDYQNGLTISQTNKFAKFLFGDNNHVKSKKNYDTWKFELYFKREVFENEKMQKMKDYFEDYFKNVIIITI